MPFYWVSSVEDLISEGRGNPSMGEKELSEQAYLETVLNSRHKRGMDPLFSVSTKDGECVVFVESREEEC